MPDLKRHAFVAVGSSWLLSVAQDGIRLVTMMVLARLLVPEDYGHFAMATAITGWLTGFGFSNFAPNILREQGEPGEIATYLLFGLALHGALAIAGLGAAACLWYVLDRPVVGALVAIATIALPLQVPAQIEGQLLQREFRWRDVRLWQLCAMVAGSAASVFLAWWGFGPFALLAGVLIEPLPLAVLLLATRPLRPLRVVPAIRTRLQAFGWPMMGCYLFWASRNVATTWSVGTILGPEPLGLLNRGMGLAGIVLGRFSGQMAYALLPVLTKAGTEMPRRSLAGRLLVRSAIWMQTPLAIGLVLSSDLAVRILYGKAWTDVSPLLLLLAPLTMLHATLDVLNPMVLAIGRPILRMLWEIISASLSFFCIPFLLYDLHTYLIFMNLAMLLTFVVACFIVLHTGWITIQDLVHAFFPAVTAAAVGLVAALPLLRILPGITGEMIAAPVFGFLYLAVLRTLFPHLCRELLSAVPSTRMPAWFTRIAHRPVVLR